MPKALVNFSARLKGVWTTSLYRNAAYLMIGNGIGAALGFVFWAVAARYYSAHDVGLSSAAIASLQLLAMVCNLGLEIGIIRFLPGSRARTKMINATFVITGCASLALSFGFVYWINVWSPGLQFLKQGAFYLVLFPVFVAATAISTVMDSAFIAGRNAGLATARMAVFNIAKLLLAILLSGVLGSYGLLNSWGIASITSIVFGYCLLLPRTHRGSVHGSEFRFSQLAELSRYSGFSFVAKMAWYLPSGILPIMVLRVLGEEVNAYFFIAWTLSATLSLIAVSVSNSLFAEGSHEQERIIPSAARSLKFSMAILLPVAVLAWVFARQLLSAFGPSYANQGTALLQLLVISLFPATVNQIYFSTLRVLKGLKELVALGVVVSGVTLLLSYWLLPVVGILAVGIAWLVSQTAALLWIILIRGWGKLFFKHGSRVV